jgi:hypothetical protein
MALNPGPPEYEGVLTDRPQRSVEGVTAHLVLTLYVLIGYSCPTTRHEGAWVERYSFYSFSNSALDGGEWWASRPGRALAPGKGPQYPFYRRLGGPQSRNGHRGYRKNPFASAGDRTSIARLSSPSWGTRLTYILITEILNSSLHRIQ